MKSPMSPHSPILPFSHSHSTIRSFDHSIISSDSPHSHSTIRSFDHSIISSSPAFTLVELLVVIAIIGILAGVLLSTFSGGSESARAARCLSNMKNLANACQVYGMKDHRYPLAGSREYVKADQTDGKRRTKMSYTERPGWISWNSRNGYPNGVSSAHRANASVSLYSTDDEESIFALTNGCLWKYVAGHRETYVCPSHAKKMGVRGTKPVWSYLMNGYFGWDEYKGSRAYAISTSSQGQWFNGFVRADRRLLFAEVPFMGYSAWQPEGTSGTEETDAVLQYATSDLTGSDVPRSPGNETLGANHVQGKNLFAHVAFADGHVEKLRIPFSGTIKNPQVDEGQLKSLTSWLCAGKDVSFDGKQYRKLTD